MGAALVIGWASSSVLAAPPLVTDDPEVADYHKWELNIPFTLEQSSTGAQSFIPFFDVSYGVAHNMEVTLSNGFLHARPRGARSAYGISDQAIGLNYRFLKSTHGGLQASLFPQATFATGSARRGLGAGGPSYDFPLIVQRDFGQWTIDGELMYEVSRPEGSPNHWFLGGAASYPVSRKLTLVAEVYGQSANEAIEIGGRGRTLWNIGGSYGWKDGARAVLFSAGRAFRGDPGLTVYVGQQFRF